MKRKFVRGLTCMVFALALLGGCGRIRDLDETSVYIRKDGSVSSAVYEPFDTDIYKEEDLQRFVEDAVSAYNQSTVGSAKAYTKDSDESLLVAIDSLEVKGDDAVLKLEYASCEDYLKFNEAEGSILQLASGTVAGAGEAGIDMSRMELLNAEGTDKISGNDIDEAYHVVFVEGTASLAVEGSVQYVSADVKVEDKDMVQVDSKGTLSCIVFK